MKPPEAADRASIEALPKVELHVHLEGAIRPETLLELSRKNGVDLPPKNLEELRDWYRFTGFPHFVEVYMALSKCVQGPEDLERITRDFLRGQAEQNILHTEATFTALTHYKNTGMPFDEQFDAIRRARDWARRELGVTLLLIVDIARDQCTAQEALLTARWVAEAHGDGLVAALGLGGYEVGFPPERFTEAFALAAEAGVPAVIHAGETAGAESVRGAVEALGAIRIGHGVRALEDATVVDLLKEREIVLEVCPTSNLCLKVFETLEEHPFPRMLEAGLAVTLNSDDPPLFNTTLNGEHFRVAKAFGLGLEDFQALHRRAADASLLPPADKQRLLERL